MSQSNEQEKNMFKINELFEEEYLDIPESKIQSLLNEELSCPICMDVLNNALVTECLHRFCQECIQKHLRQLKGTGNAHECPMCREKIKSSRNLR